MGSVPDSRKHFHCHSCETEITPRLPEYICPSCESSFIEDVTGLHSHPSNYVWGHGELDNVLTQMFEDYQPAGPPPAEKEQISSLPTLAVSQEQADSEMDCPLCKEDYAVGETVRQLPCNHVFHSDCVVPWLEMHDTCPVCRNTLKREDLSSPPQPQCSQS